MTAERYVELREIASGKRLGVEPYKAINDALTGLQDALDALESQRNEFRKHAVAAERIYDGIYRVVAGTCGVELPPGCSPLEAVITLATKYSEKP